MNAKTPAVPADPSRIRYLTLAIHLEEGERKPDFCNRSRAALLALAPEPDEETKAAKEAAR